MIYHIETDYVLIHFNHKIKLNMIQVQRLWDFINIDGLSLKSFIRFYYIVKDTWVKVVLLFHLPIYCALKFLSQNYSLLQLKFTILHS